MLAQITGQTPDVQENPDRRTEELIEEIGRGSREALAELYEAAHSAVYGFALSVVKSRPDAEDVVQDTFVKIWQSAASYEPQGKPMAWIFTITRNFALSCLRKEGRTVPVTPQDWQGMFEDVKSMDDEDRVVLFSLMSALDEEEREIVMLHAVAGLKHREIASFLDLGLSNVLSRYSRALKKLRRVLEEV